MSEEEKKRLKEYQKNYYEAKKSQYVIIKQFCNCDIIINKIVLSNYDLIKHAIQLLNLHILDRLTEIKAQ